MKARIYPMVLSILISMFLLTGTTKAGQAEYCPLSGHENTVEPALTIEGWMLDENNWIYNSHNCVGQVNDHSLSLEAWMTDIQSWESFNYASSEREEPLRIESWMTNSLKWNLNDPLMAEVTENELFIESWMTDPAYWHKQESR